MTQKDKEFIYSLLPDWCKNTKKGLDPIFYGSMSYKTDKEIVERINKIFGD